ILDGAALSCSTWHDQPGGDDDRCYARADSRHTGTNTPFPCNPLSNGSRVLGAHFYGPYFRYEARGAHPGAAIRPPIEAEFSQYLAYADDLVTATVAPELPGAKEFALACRAKGVRTNVGHSWATFDQMTQAVEWGIRHVDHLFCAMSDKSKLRQ